MFESIIKKLAKYTTRDVLEYTYFDAKLADEPTHSLPGPKNYNTINESTIAYQAHFLRCLTDICLCVCEIMLPVMAFLSISALGFTCTRCGPATVRGVVN